MHLHRVVFTSDLHGNEDHYKMLVRFASTVKADTIILGGDLAPKDFERGDFIAGQKSFYKSKFLEYISALNMALPYSKIFVMPGNTDTASSMSIIEHNSRGLYATIHNRRMRLTEDLDLAGYPYVNSTPFSLKDWEKRDVLGSISDESYKKHNECVRHNGIRSDGDYFVEHDFSNSNESIEKDLSNEEYTKNAENTIYVMHAPPFSTNLDKTMDNRNAGSLAIRNFIEKHKPYITLHGHIHETVEMTGDYKHRIGSSFCYAAGHQYEKKQLALLVFDAYNPLSVKRVLI